MLTSESFSLEKKNWNIEKATLFFKLNSTVLSSELRIEINRHSVPTQHPKINSKTAEFQQHLKKTLKIQSRSLLFLVPFLFPTITNPKIWSSKKLNIFIITSVTVPPTNLEERPKMCLRNGYQAIAWILGSFIGGDGSDLPVRGLPLLFLSTTTTWKGHKIWPCTFQWSHSIIRCLSVTD